MLEFIGWIAFSLGMYVIGYFHGHKDGTKLVDMVLTRRTHNWKGE